MQEPVSGSENLLSEDIPHRKIGEISESALRARRRVKIQGDEVFVVAAECESKRVRDARLNSKMREIGIVSPDYQTAPAESG